MGYTHYHPQTKDITEQEWAKIVQDVKKVLVYCATVGAPTAEEYDLPDNPAIVDDEIIRFNGIGDNGHETFVITRVKEEDFSCTKTNEKPYDLAVVAVLCIVKYHTDALDITSDGSVKEWEYGAKCAAMVVDTVGWEELVPFAQKTA